MHEQKEGSIKKFYQLIRLYIPPIGIIIISMMLILLQGGCTLLIPLAARDFIDKLNLDAIQLKEIILIASIFFTQIALSAITIYIMNYNSQYVISKIRSSLWNKILKLPTSYFDKNTSGDIMSRISNDTLLLKEFITSDLVMFISGIVSIVASLLLLFFVDWKMTVLTLIAIPTTMIIIMPLSKKMFVISKKTQEETAKFQSGMNRVLSDIRLVKASIAEEYEEKTGTIQIDKLFRLGLKEGMINATIQPFTTMAIFLLLILVFGYGSMRVSNGTLSAGSLVAIIYYMFQVATPCVQLSSFFTKLQRALGASERIENILEMEGEKEVLLKECSGFIPNSNGLSFSNLSFSYNKEKVVLDHLSFNIELGTVTAIVGPSGVGKTTIFSLLERFYSPERGHIYYKGEDINGICLKKWREKIAYVTQEASIMDGSIKDNLVYGQEKYSMNEINKAIREVGLETFIENLPMGYDTKVGEHGVLLSGGQRQRIALARAILRNPEILLLDEATAHLDSCTEKEVLSALKKLMKGRTTLVIAHRLSTVQNAHCLIVLENGKVSGSGTHDELMADHSLYQKMVRQQFTSKK